MPLASPIAPHSAAPCRWLSIVGIGEDGAEGLSPIARGLVEDAEIVFGGKRHLELAKSLIRGAARRKRGQRDGANFALGDLAVMLEEIVWKTGRAGDDARSRRCFDFDGDGVERINVAQIEVRGRC